MNLKSSLTLALLLAGAAVSASAANYLVVVPLGNQPGGVKPGADPEITLTLRAGELPRAKVDQDYSQDMHSYLTVTGDPAFAPEQVSWSVASGALPEGLKLEEGGLISGKPTTVNDGGASFQVMASYKTKTGQQAYTIVVNGQVLEVTSVALSEGPILASACAVTVGGRAVCWGNNSTGKLGNGTETNSKTPVQVAGLESGVRSVTVGSSFACALTSSGSVKCWGSNAEGQLGNGTNTISSVPVQVTGFETGVTSVEAGRSSICAVRLNSAWCWGNNDYGQLGNGTTVSSNVPLPVTGLSAGVQAVSMGANHACALVEGSAKCWGSNAGSALGDGSTTSSLVPVQVSGLSSGVQRISAGTQITCAIHDGAAKCWGSNGNGEIGDGTTTASAEPKQVLGLYSGVSSIVTSGNTTCAITGSGALLCWGNNSYGQVGDGTTTNSPVPVQVQGLPSGVTGVVVGYRSTCAIAKGEAKCWGLNNYGQLGDGTTANSSVPVAVRSL